MGVGFSPEQEGLRIFTHSSSHVEQLAEDAALRGVRPTEADVGETFREVHRPVGHGKGKNAPDSSDSGKGQESGQHRQVTPHAGLCRGRRGTMNLSLSLSLSGEESALWVQVPLKVASQL